MRRIILSIAFLALLSNYALAADDQAIKDRINEFSAAWNKDDAKAMAAVFTEDGSLINPFAAEAHSRDEIEKIFTKEHAQMFKGSTYTASDIKIQWITPDVALADVTGSISGIKSADGSAAPDFPHHVSWLWVKKDGKWMTAAARAFQFSGKPDDVK
ncbi:MAG TPA: SgcJ/EcaC family oxidoreductase [Tepidisphaeraceae bacterium]|jgi:uncharacterized protein (TIGR02246 family)|nr:SgcJ/EcaC family oxidoreductase [Tepidisphaeraceae bacterium]